MNHHIRPLAADGGAEEEVEESSEVGQEGHEGDDEHKGQDEHVDEGGESQKGVEENAGEEAAAEYPAVRPLRDPGAPTAQERQQHELTHLPFRPWCVDCVAGCAADHPHRRGQLDDDEGLVKISVDYGFISS